MQDGEIESVVPHSILAVQEGEYCPGAAAVLAHCQAALMRLQHKTPAAVARNSGLLSFVEEDLGKKASGNVIARSRTFLAA